MDRETQSERFAARPDWFSAMALSGVLQDIRQVLRLLRRQPAFAAVSILTLGLGIGTTTALFSTADAVLVRPLPWPQPDRLVRVEERRGSLRGRTPWTVTNGSYHGWREAATTVEGLASWRTTPQVLRGQGEPERLLAAATTPSLFNLLRARPAVGRIFVEEDAKLGQAGTAILSFGLWQRRFGGQNDAIGRTIQLDSRSFEVVGVMPREFVFPERDIQVWTSFQPLPLMSSDGRQMRVIVVNAIARLRDGVTAPQAATEATARARSVPDIRQAALSVFGSRGEVSLHVAPVLDVVTAEVRPAFAMLLAAVALLLIAATASVVSLQLARATTRRHEIAVRTAMGAGHWRLTRLWLAESGVLGLCAGLIGVIMAAALCRLIPALLPADFPRIDEIRLDTRGVLFSLGVTLVVSVICGAIPAFIGKPATLARSLSQDGIAAAGLAMRTPATRMRTSIIVGQVAIACVLLIGGGLLARSFLAMLHADRGFDANNLLTGRVTLPSAWSDERCTQLLEALQGRLGSLPGLYHVGFGNGLPLVHYGNVFGRVIPSPRDPSTTMQVSANWRIVSPEYLDALRLRLVAGRSLASTDTVSTPGVIVVNRSFAREYLGSAPIGQKLQLNLSSQLEWEVVGIVDDAQQGAITEPARPEFFVSYRQVPDGLVRDPMLLVRTDGDPTIHAETIKAIVRQTDPALTFDSIMTMDERLMTSLARPRAYALVLGGLAMLALAIAGVGLFGVLSYTTAQRTAEIGVRIALGAQGRDIAALVVRQAALMIGIGLAAGLAVTLMSAQLLSSILFGVTARDLVSFILAPVIIAVVALAACAVPARRATRVDPIRALRSR